MGFFFSRLPDSIRQQWANVRGRVEENRVRETSKAAQQAWLRRPARTGNDKVTGDWPTNGRPEEERNGSGQRGSERSSTGSECSGSVIGVTVLALLIVQNYLAAYGQSKAYLSGKRRFVMKATVK